MNDGQNAGQLIATIRKNAREEIRVSIQTYRDYTYADVRLRARREDGTSVPTPKGITARGDAISALIEALGKARELLGRQSDRPAQGRNQGHGNRQRQNRPMPHPDLDDPLPW